MVPLEERDGAGDGARRAFVTSNVGAQGAIFEETVEETVSSVPCVESRTDVGFGTPGLHGLVLSMPPWITS